jgi:predicted regulator of Ras-like GTPase activity (Roadblock/LC7/MglB family)
MNDTLHAAAALHALARDVSGIQAIVVASADGFALAQAGPKGNVADRLAAMTSSMLGLASALGRELRFGELDTLILDAADGKVLMLAIPGKQPRLLMTACDHSCVIGNALWHAKQCVRTLADNTTR